MELRDDWISGAIVDDAVEESRPLEQTGRALVHWWHLRRYREAMGIGAQGEMDTEGDFFARELERMGWGAGSLDDDGDGEWEDDGPLQLEGW